MTDTAPVETETDPTMTWHKTACVLCSANCGLEVRLDGGRFHVRGLLHEHRRGARRHGERRRGAVPGRGADDRIGRCLLYLVKCKRVAGQ